MAQAPSSLRAEAQASQRGEQRRHHVGPLTLRLVIALALFPIVPGGALIVAEAVARSAAAGKLPPYLNDALQLWMVLITAGVTLASLALWRRTVAWSAGRNAGTIVSAAVPMAQVLWWQPLWSGGCIPDDILRVGQSTALIGLWVWMTVWIWWGWNRAAPLIRGRFRMTDSARRVVLAFGSLPSIAGGYVVTMIFLDDVKLFSTPHALICGNSVWVLAACAAWLLVWRSAVLWSAGIQARTGLAALTFLGVGIAAPFLPEDPNWVGSARYMLPVMAWGGWMIVTMLIWRFRSTAVASVEDSLRCGACGYSLRGLYATRCPECGNQPTLDELFTLAAGAGDA